MNSTTKSVSKSNPAEFLKLKYAAPPECCKCGSCQLVPVQRLREIVAEHDALLARIAELETERAWRPIESAPKDGTCFDAWLGDAEDEDLEFYCGNTKYRRSPNWHWLDGKFRPFMGLRPIPVFVQPTHWQPLPAPPAAAIRAGQTSEG